MKPGNQLCMVLIPAEWIILKDGGKGNMPLLLEEVLLCNFKGGKR